MAANVQVMCRFRPLNGREKEMGTENIVNCGETSVKLRTDGKDFNFDRVFDWTTSQEEVYRIAAEPVVKEILKGFHGTIFAYGQTGSGKTHTMQGPDIYDAEMKGIIPRMIETIFEGVAEADEAVEFLVQVSYFEIYMEKIRDLLDPTRKDLAIREHPTKGIYVENISEEYVGSPEDVIRVMDIGQMNRMVAETKMNTVSSRSHSVFVINVIQKDTMTGSSQRGSLFLVDLAGSEKVSKTGASGQTLDEARKINTSLSALGNVINALTDPKIKHIPYRDSKLTRILQESLGGNSKTLLIINASPASYNESETVSTLRFGTRAKAIKNKPSQNKQMSVSELTQLLEKANEEIKKLTRYLSVLEGELIQYKGEEAGDEMIKKLRSETGAGRGERQKEGEGNALGRLQTLEGELQQSKEAEKEMKERLEEKETQLMEVKAELEEKEQLYNEVYASLETAKGNMEQFEKESKGRMEVMKGLERELESLRYENKEMKIVVDGVEEEKGILEGEKQKEVEKVEALEQRVQEMEAEKQQILKENKKLKVMEEQQSQLAHHNHPFGRVLDVKVEEKEDEFGLGEIQIELDDEEEVSFSHSHLLDDDEIFETSVPTESLEMEQLKAEIAHLKEENQRKEQALQQGGEEVSGSELVQIKKEMEAKLEQFNQFKKTLIRDLDNRCERVIELEIELDEWKQKYVDLQKTTSSRALQKRNEVLERSISKLTLLHREVLSENNQFKLHKNVSDKKLQARDERIKALELLLTNSQELVSQLQQEKEAEVEKYKSLLDKVSHQMDGGMYGNRSGSGIHNAGSRPGARVAMPIRGGGGKKASQPAKKKGMLQSIWKK